MVKDIAVLMALSTLGLGTQDILQTDTSQPPQTLSEYVEAAQSETAKPDHLVTIVTNLCPVIIQASKDVNHAYAGQMGSACALLQSSHTAPEELLAMVN